MKASNGMFCEHLALQKEDIYFIYCSEPGSALTPRMHAYSWAWWTLCLMADVGPYCATATRPSVSRPWAVDSAASGSPQTLAGMAPGIVITESSQPNDTATSITYTLSENLNITKIIWLLYETQKKYFHIVSVDETHQRIPIFMLSSFNIFSMKRIWSR